MRKTVLTAMTLSFFGLTQAQTVLFEDSFETYNDFIIENVGDWILLDVDARPTYGFQGVQFANSGAAKSFQVFNATTTSPPLEASATSDWTARTGAKSMVCFAAVPGAGVNANNDWMITPQITLGTSNNILKFWAKSCDTQFGNEKFRVGISTTGSETTDFTIISAGAFVASPANAQWIEYTYNLDNYSGQAVRIAINCVSDDQFGFAIDDFSVTTATLSSEDFFKSNFSLYPNPANDILNVNGNQTITSIEITDLNGRVVSVWNGALQNVQIQTSNLQSGLYILNVHTDAGKGTAKFIKK